MEKLVLTALFAPLVGSLFAAIFGAKPKKLITGIVTSGLLFVSLISSLILLGHLSETDEVIHVKLFDWITVGSLNIPFGFVADHVSVIMMVTVTTVSALVHVYSIGYMEHDKGFNRFFSYLSAFVFSMMVLVMSDNFAGLFIGWEGVGLCSWLLIGFWYHKKDESRDVNPSISPSWAANEAFIMNRIADLGMLIGLFLIYWNVGSLQYDVVFAHVDLFNVSVITLMGIFLFIGAMGKSAQFPLHTWLADAMEGPTPVSALIHAATMVTAGVYLVVRAFPIYSQIPDVGLFIASLGAFVAVFAASMALVNTDLKRIIAYSTLSQLGYMFVAAGLGAYWIALFHLMTHAFFKALLFLGAGNVMHAMDDELNIFKMGGLHKVMKWTAILMIIASLALAGIYPFAGFFSKDKILEVAFDSHHYILWFMLWLGAGMTAFYSFRLIMLVFFGEERYKKYGFHPHEAHWYMLAAMTPLAILAVIAGFFEESFEEFVTKLLPEYHFHVHGIVTVALIGVTTLIALSGIAFAIYKYSHGGFSEKWKENPLYKLLYNQYYIPIIYEKVFTQPYKELSQIAWKQLDLRIVDATVDFIAAVIYKTGFAGRVIQSGNLSKMLRWMVIGLLVLLVLVIIYSPVR
ncbi:NADH-quinone oxidoreductase subunit L [Nitratiruptor sp. YY08-26]|uniref:NADH-quinone oxidoreductase subunit L n=1 Tax=unclassified Nitratiruptor TaxID=2624044 RepID=UPI00191658F7|nr:MULTISPECIES: NADH-quinone oxidoreductase subunit L [unclassified Nitratiruptor]BCD61495.1 NADH-quinone oxidoreductase subunit L [Nitratiruptor sp. YY08-13]BCD65429.1 NADH-quinone oxidoreductase subunit L [Nitratiruptor sp. YY08-26]